MEAQTESIFRKRHQALSISPDEGASAVKLPMNHVVLPKNVIAMLRTSDRVTFREKQRGKLDDIMMT